MNKYYLRISGRGEAYEEICINNDTYNLLKKAFANLATGIHYEEIEILTEDEYEEACKKGL